MKTRAPVGETELAELVDTCFEAERALWADSEASAEEEEAFNAVAEKETNMITASTAEKISGMGKIASYASEIRVEARNYAPKCMRPQKIVEIGGRSPSKTQTISRTFSAGR